MSAEHLPIAAHLALVSFPSMATLRAALEDGESSGASTNFDVDAFLKTKRQKVTGSTGQAAAAK